MVGLSLLVGLAVMLCGSGESYADETVPAESLEEAPLEEAGPDNRVLYKDGLEAYESERFDRAYVLWKPLAENGYAPAQYSLGKLFDEGGGSIRANPFMAALWYRQAAAQDVAAAQNNLAIMYAKGRGVPLNESRAVALWEQAAANGHAVAKFNLALSYFNGDGVDADRQGAVAWFRKAADDGVADAQFALGQLYRQGVGVPRDPGLARGWYEKAARQGHGEARLHYHAMVEVEPRHAEEPVPLETAAADEAEEIEETEEIEKSAVNPAAEETRSTAPQANAGEVAEADDLETTATAVAVESTAVAEESLEQESSPESVMLEEEDRAEADPQVETQLSALPPEAEAPELAEDTALDQTTLVQTTLDQAGDAPAAQPEQVAEAGQAAEAEQEGADTETLAAGASQQEDVIAALIETQEVSPAPSDGAWTPPAPRRKPQVAMAADRTATDAEAAPSVETATQVAAAANHDGGDDDGGTGAMPEGGFAVWLATTRKRVDANHFWEQAQGSYPEIFATVQPFIDPVEIAGSGTNYRLLAGPLPDREAGQALCQALRSHQSDAFCMVRQN